MTQTPEEIARGLSQAQRKALLDEAYYGRNGWKIGRWSVAMARLGLLVDGTSYLSPLGCSVMSILMETQP